MASHRPASDRGAHGANESRGPGPSAESIAIARRCLPDVLLHFHHEAPPGRSISSASRMFGRVAPSASKLTSTTGPMIWVDFANVCHGWWRCVWFAF